MNEHAARFGSSDSLIGVITDPAGADRAPARTAVVLLNAGVTHRVGPNRLYVRLARSLADAGFVALRFDFSGVGDSLVRTDGLPLTKSLVAETREAMDHLARTRGIERFVLTGICSGANVSFMVAREDPRVAGALLINPQAHLHGPDPELGAALRDRAMARHSWRMALFSSFRSKNWRKAVRGQLGPRRIVRMMLGFPLAALRRRARGNRAAAPDGVEAMRSLTRRGVRLFHLFCEGDEGLDYFHVVVGKRLGDAVDGESSRFEVVEGTNHLFTLRWSQDRLVDTVVDWARSFAGSASPVRDPSSP